mgnify:CR=1 FL=1
MASSFKPIGPSDVISTRTLLHEAIPITGTIISGTYADGNVKNYAHGMFQSVYDYPYLSSSANHIFDITMGYNSESSLSSSVIAAAQPAKKQNIYNQMAQLLAGYDVNGAITKFSTGSATSDTKLNDAMFISFSRLLGKDEIKKGSFQLTLGVNAARTAPFVKTTTITDNNAATSYKVDSPAGEYAVLYATGNLNALGYQPCGLLYYQAGIAVLSASIFSTNAGTDDGLIAGGADFLQWTAPAVSFTGALINNEISSSANALRNRIQLLQFNNTTELNSTIYFCRANHNEFNFSANPTYTSQSKISVKKQSTDTPVSYITTVGLYSADNVLLAVAKLSEPLRKDPTMEYTLRVRLDY